MAVNYYATGITAQGYKSLLKNNLRTIEKIIYVKGCVDIQPFVEKIKSIYVEKEYDLEYVINPYCPKEYEAIINTTSSKAIVFEVNNMQKPLKGVKVHTGINLDFAINKKLLKNYKDYISFLKKRQQECLRLAYFFLKNALLIHDEWEKVYIENMSFEKVNSIIQDLIVEIIGGNKVAEKRKAVVTERFIGATTPIGSQNLIKDLTHKIYKRYFIKGRPGTGKSTLLRAVAKAAIKSGFDVEIYYCGFDSKSLDMLIIKDLNTCIFDATSPHEYAPSKENDKVIDIYFQAVTPLTDEKYSNFINEIAMRYNSNLNVAISHLSTMQVISKQIKKIYQYCIDQEKYNLLLEEFIQIL